MEILPCLERGALHGIQCIQSMGNTQWVWRKMKEARNTPSSKRNILLLLQSQFLRKPGGHWQAKTVFRGWGKACSIFLLISLAWRCSLLNLPSIHPMLLTAMKFQQPALALQRDGDSFISCISMHILICVHSLYVGAGSCRCRGASCSWTGKVLCCPVSLWNFMISDSSSKDAKAKGNSTSQRSAYFTGLFCVRRICSPELH